MRGHKQRALVPLEELLQPDQAFEVEVVARLVQKHGVGAHQENARQRHAHLPAARQRADVAVHHLLAEAQARKHLARPALQRIAVEFLEARLALHLLGLQVALLGMDVLQIGLDLAVPRSRLLGLLGQFEQFDLHHVQLLGVLLLAALQRGVLLLRLPKVAFGLVRLSTGLFGDELFGLHLPLQVVDFLLPRQHAGLLGVRRIETHALARHCVAFWGEQQVLRRQRGAQRECLLQGRGDEHSRKPVGQQAVQPGIAAAHSIAQRTAPCGNRQDLHVWRRLHACGKKRQLGRRRIGGETGGHVELA
ncbi:hypothetical protein GALL_461690 [mine drainage metagenome]|uniref:Uncharacterized protein n=1 Tax=mine drainage metagenome TaxID=410659 RepID=A0A1J5PKY3_9ZZZZ